MRTVSRLVLAAAALALCAPARAAPKPAPLPPWTAYADCAGAYVANSRVKDADRPASMVSQMGDVAEDYAKAARAAYRRTAHAGEAQAKTAVAARIQAAAARLSAQPREAAEKLIDACPQTEPDA
jgi:hypothetical protein